MNYLYSPFDFHFSEGCWKADPRILYGSQSGPSTEITIFKKLLATAISEEGGIKSIYTDDFQLPDTWTDWTSAEKSDTESEKKDVQPVHLPIPPWTTSKAGMPMRDPCIALRIPEEIWKMVAAHMSAAEWARVSCTSKTLSRVRLETVSLAPCSMAGIHWAAARWGEAKTVALNFRGWNNQKVTPLSGVVEAACQASKQKRPAAMQHVRHFALHVEAGTSCCYKGSGLHEIVSAMRTPRLESLCLVSDMQLFLGIIPTLKHLRVEVKDQILLYMIKSAVRNNPQLQTLTICSDIHVDRQKCCELDLTILKNLRCVNLQMVMPEGLKVPPGCQVHFVCHDLLAASKVWDNGLGVACTSCHLVELEEYEPTGGRPGVPECLQRIFGSPCPNLTVLTLHCSTVGSKEEPLIIGKCLPALRELEVQATEDLHLWVGGGLSLESLAICSEVVHFEMEDLNWLLSGLKRFYYAFGTCCMVTHMLLWKLSGFSEWISTEYVDCLTEIGRVGTADYDGVALETGGCRDHTCGTCIHCLRRKHLPISDNADWPFVGIFSIPKQ